MTRNPLTEGSKSVRKVYAASAGLLLAAAVVQMYLAAVGAFDKPQDDSSFALHSMNGMMVIPVLSLVATAAAAAAKAPGRQIGLTVLPVGLVIVQALIVALGGLFDDSTGNTTPLSLAILGLHAINGMAVMGVCAMVFRNARRLMSAKPAPSEAAEGRPVRAS
ncbi:UNVERIFIED_ORG: cytochrome b561 [Microbispora rosea subsp. rosea]